MSHAYILEIFKSSSALCSNVRMVKEPDFLGFLPRDFLGFS